MYHERRFIFINQSKILIVNGGRKMEEKVIYPAVVTVRYETAEQCIGDFGEAYIMAYYYRPGEVEPTAEQIDQYLKEGENASIESITEWVKKMVDEKGVFIKSLTNVYHKRLDGGSELTQLIEFNDDWTGSEDKAKYDYVRDEFEKFSYFTKKENAWDCLFNSECSQTCTMTGVTKHVLIIHEQF
jgi:hypothetical protein